MPTPSFCSTNHAGTSGDLVDVDDVVRAERPRELEAEGHVVGREQPSCPERAGDRDGEEPDRPAPEHGDGATRELLRARGEDGVPERLLEAGDLRRKLRAVVLPDDGRRNGDEVGEPAVAVDAEDLRPLAHVRPAGPAVEAGSAGDVALGGHVVALRDVAHLAARRDDRPAELVPERQRRVHALGRPLVPAVDVEIRAADARRLDPDEHLVRLRCGDRDLVEDESGLGLALANGSHRLHGALILPRATESLVAPSRTVVFGFSPMPISDTAQTIGS